MPERIKFDLPKDGSTEIRIHGVGGTGPDALLGDPHPIQVAGDQRAGFFRPSTPDPDSPHQVEAYSWGGLTSRKATRALWILLLPFTLTNVAAWMVVRTKSARRLAHAQERLCRWMALLATVMMVSGVAAITGDLVSLQCGATPECRDGRWWLFPFGTELLNHPMRRLIVGLSLPLLVLTFLMRRSLVSRRDYEEYPPRDDDEDASSSSSPEAGEDATLSQENFWQRPVLVRNLTALHLAGTLGFLSLLLAVAIHQYYGEVETPTWVIALIVSSAAVVSVTLLWLWFLRWKRGNVTTRSSSKWYHWGFAALAGLCLALTAVAAWVATPERAVGSTVDVFRKAPLYLLLAAAALGSAIALLQSVAWLMEMILEIKRRWFRDALRGPAMRFASWMALVVGSVAVITVDRRMEIVYLILIFEVVVMALLPAWIPAAIALAGLVMAPWVWSWGGPYQLHAGAVFAVLAVLFVISDWTWPRTEFRWGGPPIMSLFGIVLLAAVISGASARVVDYLDKRQSPSELGNDVLDVLDRNYEGSFNEGKWIDAQVRVRQIYAESRTPDEVVAELQQLDVPPELSARILQAQEPRTLTEDEVLAILEEGFFELGFDEHAYFQGRQLVHDVYGLESTEEDREVLGFDEAERDRFSASLPPGKLAIEMEQVGIPQPVVSQVYLVVAQGDRRPIDIRLPLAYQWLTVGIVGSFLFSFLAFLSLYLAQHFHRPPPDDEKGAQEVPEGARPLTETEANALDGQVARMKTLKQVAGSGDLVITYIVGLLVLGTLISLKVRDEVGLTLGGLTDQEFEPGWEALVAPAQWLVTALPLLGIALIRKSYSNEASRRKIGIIWDLATFWPRRFHPLAPPAYSERAVPELQDRLKQAMERGKCAVLAAHSQGSVVGYASVLPLKDRLGSRLAFLTYGSPLGSYYRRFFPSYFKLEDFKALEERLRYGKSPYSWRNFWRPTDPIAGCVFTIHEQETETRDEKVLDPWGWWRVPGQARPSLQVHSDYLDDPKLREWINEAAKRCPKCDESSERARIGRLLRLFGDRVRRWLI